MFDNRAKRRLTLVPLVGLALSLAACDAVESSSEAEGAGGDCSVFEGETISLVVPYSPGGGYDSYARIVAPLLGEELEAEVVVENQDGAGGLLAINNLITAEPDGTHLAIMNGVGVAGGALAGAEGVQFEIEDLSLIGRVAEQKPVFVVGADSEYQSIEDVQAASGFEFASTGPGAADFVNANLLIRILGLDARVVSGFGGSEESELAVIRGDVDGQSGDLASRLGAIENGDQRPLLVLDAEPADELPDTPTLPELDLDQDQQALADALIDLSALGRPIVGPPGMPQDRLTCLRDALKRTIQSDELQKEAEEQGRPVNWMSGAELDERAQRLIDSPPEFKEALQEAYEKQ